MNSVFKRNSISHLMRNAFLDGPVDIARYESVKYPWVDKMYEKQLGFFWQPSEVDIYRDQSDFKNLSPHEQHIFTSNLQRQILLDSVQGRAPSMAFGTVASLPELEEWIQLWSATEVLHSKSYSFIIRNVYSNPSEVFDNMMNIKEIVDCATDVSKYYDELIEYASYYNLFGEGSFSGRFLPLGGNPGYPGVPVRMGGVEEFGDTTFFEMKISKYELKRRIWRALMSVNVLEGIRFYVSFACSWAFAEQKKMEGNAKIIKLIARDENLHLGFTHQLIKSLQKDDPDFAKIADEEEATSLLLFKSAVDQEKAWADYLFKDGSMIGLNKQILSEYIEWIAYKRMQAVGLPQLYKGGSNPLPWTQKWISGSEVQVAPQETEISSYTIGRVNRDVKKNTFNDFDL